VPTLRALLASLVLLAPSVVWAVEDAASTPFNAPWWGPESTTLYAGFFGLRSPDQWDNALVGLEVRGGSFWWDLHVMSGALAASDGSAYFYFGALADVPVSVVHFILSFAPGLYAAGMDHNLGFPLIFRSTAEISFAVADGLRFGVSFSHLSNGGLAHANPGIETLSLTVTVFALPY
jgi:hypothetical protein